MDITLYNHYVLQILIGVRSVDSIHALSKRIGVSYGWTYKWVQKLRELDVFGGSKMKMRLKTNNRFYRKTIEYVHHVWVKDVQFYYECIQLFGISYCFTSIDAVFVWTQGGYNIGRYKQYYPVFIKVKQSDKPIFEEYCHRIGLAVNKKNGIFYGGDLHSQSNFAVPNSL